MFFKPIIKLWKINAMPLTELLGITAFLAVMNTHLATGAVETALMYRPDQPGLAGMAGLICHPFVHVSFYHLMLDASAFVLLWFALQHHSRARRFGCLVVSTTLSFISVVLFARDAAAAGFCGLSGMAHGLMAVFCLDMIGSKSTRTAGWLGLAAVLAKTGLELGPGSTLLSAIHMGYCGRPIPESHVGGLIGGLLGYAFFFQGRFRLRA